MEFSFAIKQVKNGKKITRKGWNGKSQFITLCTNFSYLDTSTHTLVNPNHDNIGNEALVFHGTSGEQVGWLASQADMLADDWEILE